MRWKTCLREETDSIRFLSVQIFHMGVSVTDSVVFGRSQG